VAVEHPCVCRTVERTIFEKLVYIGAVSKFESSNVHLVAVTSAGVFVTTGIVIVITKIAARSCRTWKHARARIDKAILQYRRKILTATIS